ncbi:[FeFe] hydrogenase H-cluster radical SAM maturase HydE [Syntrophomonas palmitatica]|uniref:[FeFe] hydrogenase H-cluster radical SAM maturase HydE n=1 Tax=Syntrophomonas palmitatica TaxID=402877 RepID=UPI0006D06A02|nr:[FeFe] hydrogenase H-cluster radical SAM maturase HydE [Syntrophomonas palmitatica]
MSAAVNTISLSDNGGNLSWPPLQAEREALSNVLASQDEDLFAVLLDKAEECRATVLGNKVYPRGLIEFSNLCQCDCYYCGLRHSNTRLGRYRLTADEIVALAREAWEKGYQSLALQSGELKSSREVKFVSEVIKRIKDITAHDGSQGLGITLSIGELAYQQYQQLFDAGAHRYLLRIETSDPKLFNQLHPPGQSFQKRLECLQALKDIGYQVGTGVMVGLPGQTYEQLAADLLFFVERDIDMLGLGPYIPHPDTPLASGPETVIANPYKTTLKMMALARLLMPYINMVCSTALQTISADGLAMGIKAGANVVMPVMTPEENRSDYSLYAAKKYSSFEQLRHEINAAGYELVLGEWGDSPHYFRRRQL